MSTRPYAILAREGNGDISREQAAASLKLLAGSAVQRRAAVAGSAQRVVTGTVTVTDALIAGLDTRVLYVGNGDTIEEVNFSAADINTKAEFAAALAGLGSVTATLSGTDKLVITGKAGNPVYIEGSNDVVATAFGIAEGEFSGGEQTGSVAGYVPYGTPGAIAGSAAISPADVEEGAQGTFFVRQMTFKDALLVVGEGLRDAAIAELADNGLIARETIVL